MNNADADKLYRPDFTKHLDLYLQAKTDSERTILFQNIKTIVLEMQQDGILAPIQFHYVCTATKTCRIFWKIKLGSQLKAILRIVELIYPDKQEARKLAQQAIIVASKMSVHMQL